MGEWLLSRRDSTIVARHDVPGIMRKIARPSGTIEPPVVPAASLAGFDIWLLENAARSLQLNFEMTPHSGSSALYEEAITALDVMTLMLRSSNPAT